MTSKPASRSRLAVATRPGLGTTRSRSCSAYELETAIAMARDWDSALQAWVKPASATQDEKRKHTEREIAEAIRSSGLAAGAIRVFAKGSYANSTNVRQDSDVDVAVEYHYMLFSDYSEDLRG